MLDSINPAMFFDTHNLQSSSSNNFQQPLISQMLGPYILSTNFLPPWCAKDKFTMERWCVCSHDCVLYPKSMNKLSLHLVFQLYNTKQQKCTSY